MTKTIEVSISLREILAIMHQRWKLILTLAIIFAIIMGGFGLYKDKSNKEETTITDKQHVQYEKDAENYAAYQEAQQDHARVIEEEYIQIYQEQKNNPIFSVDPYRCEYEQIVVRFQDGRNYDKTIENWIATADNDKLFGESADKLSDYKESIVFTAEDDAEYDRQYDSDESVVQIIAVEGFDSAQAADYLKTYIRQRGADSGLEVTGISSAHFKGANNNVAAYQRRGRDAINTSYNAMSSITNMKNVVKEPSLPMESTGIDKGRLFKYILLGMILGLIIGVGFALLQVFRKGCVVSRRQFEDVFDLELMSDFSHGSGAAVDVMNANVDVMTGEKSSIAVFAENKEDIDKYVESLNGDGSHTYHMISDIFNDPDDIEKLQNADGIALCVRVGETRLDNVQRVILKTNKLNKSVIGYIFI